MAKTESTAVNELIDLVQSGKPADEPAADLFAGPKPRSSTRVSPPRMTSPIPPMRGAGEVEPLPRQRAPHSTSQHPMPLIPAPVRMSTADPTRGNTIPPLSRPTTRPSSPRSTAVGHALPPPRAPRATASSPAVRASTPIASRPTVPTVPPPLTPVAAPFEARGENPFASVPSLPSLPRPQPQQYPVTRPEDPAASDKWFDVSMVMPRVDESSLDGTAVVPRHRPESMSLVKKLIVPTIILAIVGVMVGGFFAFDGEGGSKKSHAAPAALAQATPSAQAPAAASEQPAVAEPAPAVAQPEPPTKVEDVAKQQAAQEQAKQSESLLPAATTAALAAAAAKPEAKVEAKPEGKVEAKPEAKIDAKVEAKVDTKPEPKLEAKPEAKSAAKPAVAVEVPKTDETPIAVKSIKTSSEPAQIREVRTAHGVVKLVDVRIDSKPSGATVMLVDNGKTSFLGSTPVATSLDPAHTYEVIFTIAGRPTQMAPLDPSKTSRLDVTLDRKHHSSSSSTAKAAPAAKLDSFIDKTDKKAAEPKAVAKAEAKSEAKVDKAEPKAVAKAVAKAEAKSEAKVDKTEPKVEKSEAKAEKAEPKLDKKADAKATQPAGEGTLMVSSKPPCEIAIDGKQTGLTTPQRSIPLPAGVHKVTFINDVAGIKKTVSVSISANQSTKLIQDLMKK